MVCFSESTGVGRESGLSSAGMRSRLSWEEAMYLCPVIVEGHSYAIVLVVRDNSMGLTLDARRSGFEAVA